MDGGMKMTAQISDEYRYEDKVYSVVAMSNPIGFDPKDYGLEPQASCTACWRGYWCEYAIKNGRIVLEKLLIHNAEDNYPEFNGVSALPLEYEDAECWTFGEDKPKIESFPKNFGHRTYETNMEINYTGKIVLGDDFIQDYYIHMGFQRPWAYKILKEFDFVDGKLTDIVDHSKVAKELREMIKRDPEGFDKMLHSNIESFVNDSFSLDTNIKAWWI